MKKVLVIDDDEDIINLLKLKFKKDLYSEFHFAKDPLQAMALAINTPFDLFLIDYHLGSHSGLALAESIGKTQNLMNKVIMISSDVNRELQLKGYEIGVSNFVSKPIDFDLLKAIMKKNILALDARGSVEVLFEDLIINPSNFSVDINSKQKDKVASLKLSPTEFSILLKLAQANGNVVTKEDLALSGLDRNKEISFKSLEVHLTALRKKLRSSSIVEIRSKWGVGYYLAKQSP